MDSRMLDGLPAGFGLGTTDHAPDDGEAGPAVNPAETNVAAAHRMLTTAVRARLVARAAVSAMIPGFRPCEDLPRPLP